MRLTRGGEVRNAPPRELSGLQILIKGRVRRGGDLLS